MLIDKGTPSESQEEKTPEKPRIVSVSKIAQDVKLLDIIETYDSNPMAGDQQFKGERLRVTGIVKAVRENITGGGYYATIQPTGGKFLFSGKALAVETADQQALAAFNEGDAVTVAGTLIGLDRMEYPRLNNAVVERKASAMEPIPGTIYNTIDGAEESEISFNDPDVQRAAKLYMISLNMEIKKGFMQDFRNMDRGRLFEILLLEKGNRHSFFRIGMLGVSGGRGVINYAFVVVERDPDGNFPEVSSESFLLHEVFQSGEKPTVQDILTIKRANGWRSGEGWPK